MADALVTGDERRLGLDRPVTLGSVEIGVANAGGCDLDHDLAGARLRHGTSSITSGFRNSRTTAAFMVGGMFVLIPIQQGDQRVYPLFCMQSLKISISALVRSVFACCWAATSRRRQVELLERKDRVAPPAAAPKRGTARYQRRSWRPWRPTSSRPTRAPTPRRRQGRATGPGRSACVSFGGSPWHRWRFRQGSSPPAFACPQNKSGLIVYLFAIAVRLPGWTEGLWSLNL